MTQGDKFKKVRAQTAMRDHLCAQTRQVSISKVEKNISPPEVMKDILCRSLLLWKDLGILLKLPATKSGKVYNPNQQFYFLSGQSTEKQKI